MNGAFVTAVGQVVIFGSTVFVLVAALAWALNKLIARLINFSGGIKLYMQLLALKHERGREIENKFDEVDRIADEVRGELDRRYSVPGTPNLNKQ